ncbi:MAG TPA: Fe(2+)-trafficking protein [Thermoanaerobaculia bacterium]|nr:Fe(2+)-trafficking protein [Thermoanaerobaculia bacterium]
MSATLDCARCGRADAPALPRAPVRGRLGAEILARVCADCWAEWQGVEVMVINELRLNFLEPSSQEILAAEMRRFLGLDGAPGEEPEKRPDPR